MHFGRAVGSGGELAHLRKPPGREPVMLGTSRNELVLDEAAVDRLCRDRVDLLVCLDLLNGWDPLVTELEAEIRALSPAYTINQVKEKPCGQPGRLSGQVRHGCNETPARRAPGAGIRARRRLPAG